MAYIVRVQHYGERIQTIPEKYTRKYQAQRRLELEAEIAKGYCKSWGWIDGVFVVFGEDGIHKTSMWVSKER